MSGEKGTEPGQSPDDRNLIRKHEQEAGEPDAGSSDESKPQSQTPDKPVATRFTASETGDEREPDLPS